MESTVTDSRWIVRSRGIPHGNRMWLPPSRAPPKRCRHAFQGRAGDIIRSLRWTRRVGPHLAYVVLRRFHGELDLAGICRPHKDAAVDTSCRYLQQTRVENNVPRPVQKVALPDPSRVLLRCLRSRPNEVCAITSPLRTSFRLTTRNLQKWLI